MGALGTGKAFSRGRRNVGGGRVIRTPSAEEVMGQVVRSWFISAWAQSRAVEEMCVESGE